MCSVLFLFFTCKKKDNSAYYLILRVFWDYYIYAWHNTWSNKEILKCQLLICTTKMILPNHQYGFLFSYVGWVSLIFHVNTILLLFYLFNRYWVLAFYSLWGYNGHQDPCFVCCHKVCRLDRERHYSIIANNGTWERPQSLWRQFPCGGPLLKATSFCEVLLTNNDPSLL